LTGWGTDETQTNRGSSRLWPAVFGALLVLAALTLVFWRSTPYSAPSPVAVGAATATVSATATSTTRSAKSSATSVTADPQEVLPDKMARLLRGTRQVIVVTGARLGSNVGTLSVFNLDAGRWTQVMNVPSRLGTYGLIDGEQRRQGSRTTPTGVWYIGDYVFGQHKTPPSGTLMPYRAITPRSWWSAEHDSTYNSWVESSRPVDGEHLADATIQYEFAFSSGYNEAPKNESVQGRGTAIFIHVFDPPTYHGGFTAGCISVSRDSMLQLFRTIDPARKPTCAVGTLRRGTSTSIYAY
jgi:L,D-peptidoglycan transpeptidase YkuD (ErfK/YbiS/YcfS/YnhG family)